MTDSDKHARAARLEADRQRRAETRRPPAGDLAEFIRARLDEDEAAAKAAADGAEKMSGEPFAPPTQAFGVTEVTVVRTHIARHDPARVLRDVAAKRAILAEHQPFPWPELEHIVSCRACGVRESYPCPTLRALAAVWSDHPDYQPEWKPA